MMMFSFLMMVAVAFATGGETVVRLTPGDYHLYARSAERLRFHVSNHDQPGEALGFACRARLGEGNG